MASIHRYILSIMVIFLLIFVIGCGQKNVPAPSQGKTLTADATQQEIARITEERTREVLEQYGVASAGSGSGQQMEGDCDTTPNKPRFSHDKYYTGPLIDTHLHMPVSSVIVSDIAIRSGFEDMPHAGKIPASDIICLMKKEGITKAFSFFIIPNAGMDQSLGYVEQVTSQYPGFVPFFMPPLPIESLNPTPEEVDNALAKKPGFYQGYGEARFDFANGKNALPEDQYLLDMYRLSDKHNLIVQIHPEKGQIAAIERLLQKYPNVIFLVHLVLDERDDIDRLMSEYDNIYYSLDAELTSLFGYHTIQNNQGPAKEEFIAFTEKNMNTMIDEDLGRWEAIIKKHPDRFTWGTDRWFTWHFDPEVGAIIEELSRAFIGQLDPAIQEKIAYQNAEEMLKKR
ncbi:amidohydrolase family protein [Candidatus Woesearchaeota archaeon]|nr:amidohydrolase family protein [Candidatus Woesearchaeota archaeon]